jgi:hypothetical protein
MPRDAAGTADERERQAPPPRRFYEVPLEPASLRQRSHA